MKRIVNALFIMYSMSCISFVCPSARTSRISNVVKEPLQNQSANIQLEFDQERKKKDVIELVNRGKTFFLENTLSASGRAFTHTKEFVDGELYLFIFDMNGMVIAHGEEEHLLWDNMYEYKDDFGASAVQVIIEKAKGGGGWVTYEWRGSVKQSYVQQVSKDGKEYVIGSGYYTHSKADSAVGIVKRASELFDNVLSQGLSPEVAFSIMSYPKSQDFVRGDLYLYAISFDGTIRAHSDRPGVIGLNFFTIEDEDKDNIIKNIMQQLKNSDSGAWFDNVAKNAPKRSYVEKITDKQGNDYFIVCGYFPDADRDAVVDLVRKGFQFMKSAGKSAAAEKITDPQDYQLHYGDIWLEVYTTKGLCVAHGDNAEFVGKNLVNAQDEDGRYYIQEYIKAAESGRGWVNVKLNNSFMTAYVEKIDLGLDEFVITAGTYPVSKSEVTELLVKSAVGLLESKSLYDACQAFTSREGNFLRGDLSIFVFDQEGICYAYGDEYELIWTNMLAEIDDDGKPYVQLMINTSAQGPGYVSFKKNNRLHRAFVQQVEKDGVVYTVGSGFYV